MRVEEIRAIVVEAIEFLREGSIGSITDESRLVGDLGLDYLDQRVVIMGVEDQLGIPIPDEKTVEMETVGDLVKAAQEALEERGDESPRTGQETISGNDAGSKEGDQANE